MFWADRIAEDICRRFPTGKNILIRDEKTVSGRVHVGSMRGAAVHGILSEILTERGVKNTFIWEHNDFDPMDDIPTYLNRAAYESYLGKPLCDIPAPDSAYANYGAYFAQEFAGVIERSGWHPAFRWTSELYRSGTMDGAIREALEQAELIRRIQEEVSGAKRAQGWLPISVICPQCGKMTTTEASDFDGETVFVHCRENKVAYTRGCGYTGRLSPFQGGAKLYWKVDWPAKWKIYGVSVEGAGKDHSTKGGSRDVANRISRDVFHCDPPYDIPYEFLLVGGKKMSSSKGRGSSAADIAKLLPPKLFRLMLLSKDVNQQFNFDPEGDTIPVLYDLYDKFAESCRSGVRDDYARLFELTQMPEERKHITVPFLPRFSQVAFITQMPHLDLAAEAARMKGAPLNGGDQRELEERAAYARAWLDAYAPEKFVFRLQENVPEQTRDFSVEQKKALGELATYLEARPNASGEDIHSKLHELRKTLPIAPVSLFSALYIALLGKSFGPKAGWFLSVLPRPFLLKRLKEASS